MKEVTKAVDIELSKEETKVLLKAKVILKEMSVMLNKIETKRQPNAEKEVREAYNKVGDVLCCYGAYFDEGVDKEVDELNKKLDRLDEEDNW